MAKPKVVYRGKMFTVEKTSFKANGRTFVFDRIKSANTVTVLPILKGGRIILERQYRYSIDKYLYELPAGHIESGETPSFAAIRELEEETGYRAGKIKLMFNGYPNPGSKTELVSYFVATKLVKTKTHKEPDEVIEISTVTLKRALEMIKKNKIQDLKSIALILFYAREAGA